MRARSAKPVFVKLPPFATDVERDVVLALAWIAQEAGASGLTCSNTRLVGEPRLSVGRGGLSGRALWQRTPSHRRRRPDGHGRRAPDQRVRRCLAGRGRPDLSRGRRRHGPDLLGAHLRGSGDRRDAHRKTRTGAPRPEQLRGGTRRNGRTRRVSCPASRIAARGIPVQDVPSRQVFAPESSRGTVVAESAVSTADVSAPQGEDIAVRLESVVKRFGDVAAVDGVDLDVRRGEFFSMLGPSGSGKTTCLRMIAGFETPTSGPDPAGRRGRVAAGARTSATSTPCSRTTRCSRT